MDIIEYTYEDSMIEINYQLALHFRQANLTSKKARHKQG
jgi:hypothetical protein